MENKTTIEVGWRTLFLREEKEDDGVEKAETAKKWPNHNNSGMIRRMIFLSCTRTPSKESFVLMIRAAGSRTLLGFRFSGSLLDFQLFCGGAARLALDGPVFVRFFSVLARLKIFERGAVMWDERRHPSPDHGGGFFY